MSRFFAFETTNYSTVELKNYSIRGLKINLNSLTIPPFKNVQTNFENIISYNTGSGPVDVTVTSGFYTLLPDLINTVQTVLQASDPDFTVTIESFTNIVTISHSSSNFSMTGGFLKNYLGFSTLPDGSTNTYSSTYSGKLIPYYGFGVNITCIKNSTYGLSKNYNFVLLSDLFSFSDNKNFYYDKQNFEISDKRLLVNNSLTDFEVKVDALFIDGTSKPIDFQDLKISGVLVLL